MAELWDLLPVWLKWVVFVSGWLVATTQRLWRRMPANLFIFGLAIHRGSSQGSIGTENRRWIKWDSQVGEPTSMPSDDKTTNADQPERH